MRNLEKQFKNRKIDFDKLLDYGFIKSNHKHLYEKNICDDSFKIIIEISALTKISKVIDLNLNEEYILVDVESASGEFVGRVKEEYESVLNDFIEKCSIKDIFKSNQAKLLIKYIKNKYNDDLEYLWKNFPNDAISRNKENNKWYGLLMIIEENKLGIDSNKLIEIIDLRYQKEKIDEIIDDKNIFRGYHMNKNSWITIKLDESVEIKKIYELIDNSYELSLKK